MRFVSLLAVAAMATSAVAEPTRDYVVREHETCLEIAIRETGSQDGLKELHRLNPQLGPLPHNLVAGQVIKLPGRAVEADAHLADQRGAVEVRRAGDDVWKHQDNGASLFRAWRVGARERATAQILFRDTSKISMRENTVVVILGAAAREAITGTFKTTLQNGALRTRLAELDGGKPKQVDIATESGGVTLTSGGGAVVGVDTKQTTRVSNHRGPAATLRSTTGKSVIVKQGMGSTVAVKRDPTPPRPLPPTPAWVSATPIVALGWAGNGGHLHAAWTAEPRAKRYRIEVSLDPELMKVVLALEVDAAITVADIDHLPVGDYFISIAALDEDNLESLPSAARPVHAVEVVSDGTPTHDAMRVMLGSTLALPEGVTCREPGGEPASTITFAHAGKIDLACDGAELPLRMNVAAVEAHAATARVAIGASIDVPVTVSIENGLPVPAIAIAADPGIEARFERRSLHVRGVAPGEHRVRFLIGAAEIGVATIHVDEQRREVVSPNARAATDHHLEIGVFDGGSIRSGNGVLGAVIAARLRRTSVELAISRDVTTDTTGGQLGVAIALARGAFVPRLRFGLAGAESIGGYAGLDLAAQVQDHLMFVTVFDGIVIDRELGALATVGLRATF